MMENDLVKRMMWSGLMAGVSALSAVVAARIAAYVWLRVFGEEPPE